MQPTVNGRIRQRRGSTVYIMKEIGRIRGAATSSERRSRSSSAAIGESWRNAEWTASPTGPRRSQPKAAERGTDGPSRLFGPIRSHLTNSHSTLGSLADPLTQSAVQHCRSASPATHVRRQLRRSADSNWHIRSQFAHLRGQMTAVAWAARRIARSGHPVGRSARCTATSAHLLEQ